MGWFFFPATCPETTALIMLLMQLIILVSNNDSEDVTRETEGLRKSKVSVLTFAARALEFFVFFFFLTYKINIAFIFCLPFSSNLLQFVGFVVSGIQFKKMRIRWWWLVLAVLVSSLEGSSGIRFVIDREECLSHKVEIGATVHFSFVVIKSEGAWHYNEEGIDLVVKGPNGEQIQDFRDKISEKSEFPAHHEGVYRFCFTNKSPYHETIDFDILAGYFVFHDEHAKDEHFKPLFEHIGKLEEALYNIQFEQHWLEAQTERQAIVNEGMSRRAIHKALYESAALIGSSVLQVFLLRRLFERKIGLSRV